MLRKVAIVTLILGLAGCSTHPAHTLGMSKEEWKSIDREEKKLRLANARATNELHYTKQSEQVYFNLDADTPLRVTIEGGTAMMPPFTEKMRYEPVSFVLREGGCDEVELKEADGHSKVPLRACLIDDTFLLDPSAFDQDKKLGSIRIHASPVWKTGFSYYPITTTGLVRLERARVRLELIDSSNA